MPQVNTQQTYSPTGNTDKDKRRQEVRKWSIQTARKQAEGEGIDLTISHIHVLEFLRSFYIEYGWPKNTHDLVQLLDEEFHDLGGKRFLYFLFPAGPVTQGTRLAGLPQPLYSYDSSFGTVY